jgi:hypothetical protein
VNGKYIDLHTHSTASDGTDSPARVLELAAELGLKAVALTDHDTVAGLPEFLAAGERHPEIEAVPGVEISCSYSCREIHLVGLFVDHRSADLTEFLERRREDRIRRNCAMMEKLRTLGFELSWDDPEFAAGADGNIGRPHFARALMRRYGFSSMAAVFEKLLGHSRPAFVPRQLPSPAQAIEVLHSAGGVAVWAHPIYRDRSERAWLRRGLRRFTEWKLDAVEGYYSLFGPNETALVTELAAAFGAALSGGSDYHGGNSTVALGTGAGGLRVPAELLTGLKARRSSLPR